jgi:DNA-binding transcriptional ArsR family regulator
LQRACGAGADIPIQGNGKGGPFLARTGPSASWGCLVNQDPLQPKHCAELLRALGAPERLRIIRFLRDGPRNVTEIAEMLDTHAVNVSHHMNVLKVAGLVESEKQGRFVLYSLTPGVLQTDEEHASDRLNLGCCRLELPAGEKPAGD